MTVSQRALGLTEAGGTLALEIERLRIAALRARLLGPDDSARDFDARRIQRNLTLINTAVRAAAQRAPLDEAGQRAALFVARSCEQLAELPELRTQGLWMTAAIHYELAGLQANAATMARKAVPIDGIDLAEPLSLDEICSLFLQRRFLACSIVSEAEPPTDPDVHIGSVVRAATNLVTEAVIGAATFFLRGDTDHLAQAVEDLDIARAALLEAGSVQETILVDGLRALVPRLESTSTWATLGSALEENPLWERYLMALGRGFGGSDVLQCRSVSELWPSQMAAVQGRVLDGDSHVVRMPTSAGKTRIAEMAIIHALARRSGAKALYVAPFNALTNEVEAGFNALFVDLGLSLSSLTGAFDFSSVDDDAASDDLLIITPEKLDQLLRSGSQFLADVDLVVLDEGHVVGDEQRGPKYELTVSRLRRRRPEAAFIALSAVVPDETLVDFSQWLHATAEPISSAWRPTKQRLARLDWDGKVGDLAYPGEGSTADGDETALVVPGVILSRAYPHVNASTKRTRRPIFPEAGHRAQVVAAYAWEVVSQGPVLVYCGKPQDARAVAKALSDRAGWAREREGDPIPSSFREQIRSSVTVAEEWLGYDHEVTNWLRLGIGVHYAGLPSALKTAVEDDFRARKLGVLAATATLAQGVNLPVRTLLVHTTRRYDEALNRQIQLPARDFWNIAGRVGRAGAETEGTVVFLALNDVDEADFQYYRESRDAVEPVTSALYDLLQGLVANRISGNEIARQLDPEMLALLVEEQDVAVDAVALSELLGDSLFSIQSAARQINPQRLWQVMAETSRAIASRVPEEQTRAVYAATGLSAVSSLRIHAHVKENRDVLDELSQPEAGRPSELYSLMLEGLSRSREMEPRYSFDGSREDLIDAWLDGAAVGDLATNFDVKPVELTQFIEDFFCYRLPWGLSGYMSIAAAELGLEGLPAHWQPIPMLVRHGVPREAAAWAMALGVPARGVAQELGAQYEAGAERPTSAGLRRWLGQLEPDQLSRDFGLSPESVAAAVKVVLRAHGNDHLREVYAGRPLFPLRHAFQPPRSARGRLLFKEVQAGAPLHLTRDYDSFNRNAVLVHVNDRLLMPLGRTAGDVVALELDAGRRLSVSLDAASSDNLASLLIQPAKLRRVVVTERASPSSPRVND